MIDLRTLLLSGFLALACVVAVLALVLYATKNTPSKSRGDYVVYYGETVEGNAVVLGVDYEARQLQSYTSGFSLVYADVPDIAEDVFTTTLDFGDGDVCKLEFRHGQDAGFASVALYKDSPKHANVALSSVTVRNLIKQFQIVASIL